ncbi:MAG: hypothetical protein IKA29_01230 [Clostridia bacterium]|nr:hypothetical protein [Clostridia bacterium]
MPSVTKRINEIKQPRGGYLKPSAFTEIIKDDGKSLSEENVHSSIVGMAVDYLTRMMVEKAKNKDKHIEDIVRDSFVFSIMGYDTRLEFYSYRCLKKDIKNHVDIEFLLSQIRDLDDNSIIAACKTVTYDVWFRNTIAALGVKDAIDTNPDQATIENIRIMVNRGIEFFQEYGPVVCDGFTFEGGGYTDTVDTGDGDFLTEDTLWDFKVSKSKPTNKHTLQLLMYWIMGQHTLREEFRRISKLGIFNPRLNTVYLYDLSNISLDVVKEVEREVICY